MAVEKDDIDVDPSDKETSEENLNPDLEKVLRRLIGKIIDYKLDSLSAII